MHRVLFLLFAVSGLLSVGGLFSPLPAAAGPRDAATSAPLTMPSQMCRGYYFVPLTVSAQPDRPERAEDRTLWMLYDTGASTTYVDPDAIERVTVQDAAGMRRVNFANAAMGPLSVNRLPARVRDLDHLSVALGREIDGILSFDVFKDFLLTLDYGVREIHLAEGALPEPDGKTVFDAAGRDKRPWLRVVWPSRTRRMLIDSGAAGTPFALNRLKRYPLTAAPVEIGASVRFTRIEYRTGGRLDGEARIGPFVFDRPLVEEVPETELIGAKIMRHFVWTFDQRNKRVRIDRIEGSGPIAQAAEVTHGLALRPASPHLVIEALLPGSAAAEAGLAPGDVLTHFDGRPVADRGCAWTPDARPETLHVTRLRDGEAMDVDLPLVTLVP